MRVLFDESMPRPLRRDLVGHDVSTVGQMGWAGNKNGVLLGLAAAAGFEALLTVICSTSRICLLWASLL